MNSETLKKAVELNEELEEVLHLVNQMKDAKDEKWYIMFGEANWREDIFNTIPSSRLRNAFKKATNEVLTEIKKEIEAL